MRSGATNALGVVASSGGGRRESYLGGVCVVVVVVWLSWSPGVPVVVVVVVVSLGAGVVAAAGVVVVVVVFLEQPTMEVAPTRRSATTVDLIIIRVFTGTPAPCLLRNVRDPVTGHVRTVSHILRYDGKSFCRVDEAPWTMAMPTRQSAPIPIHCPGTLSMLAASARPTIRMT